jgi:NAD(P)-dependent dehydrogenase (short-subunit alcohol dehydrogenase family)
MGRLNGKVAVITGASTGIGAETARLFVSEGASVIIGGRRQQLCEKLASDLGPGAIPVRMDVTDEASIAGAIDLAMKRFGRLDCLFNNAGSAGVLGPIADTNTAALDDTIALLFRAVVLGVKHAARVMKGQGGGAIVNNASAAAFFAGYAPHIYSGCKAAVVGFTRSVATELGEQGIRVNCVCPGPIPTPIFGAAFGLAERQSEELAAQLGTAFKTVQPIPRAGHALDIARAVLWLASDDASFVNGHALVVDGGLSLGRKWSGMDEYFGEIAKMAAITSK